MSTILENIDNSVRPGDDFYKYANDICINSFKKLVFTHQDQYISRKLIDVGLLAV